MKIAKSIEIVSTADKLLSSMGAGPRQSIAAVLREIYTDVNITIINSKADVDSLVRRQPDLVFLGMKVIPGSGGDGQNPIKWMAEYLDNNGIAYTGSNHHAHSLEINKSAAKRCVDSAGLPTANFFVSDRFHPEDINDNRLRYPVFIKPLDRAGSQGIDMQSIAHTPAAMRAKIAAIARELSADSMVEEYLPGKEYSVGILVDELTGEKTAMPIEIIAPLNTDGSRLLTAAVKKADTEISLAVDDPEISRAINSLALSVFEVLGARDYARIDIRLDSNGNPFFLEANLMPSLKNSHGNYFPKACLLNAGLNYDDIVQRLARLGLSRKHQEVPVLTTDVLPMMRLQPSSLPA